MTALTKEQINTRIEDRGIVAVVRASSGEEAVRIAEACLEGGVDAMEITFTVPGAHHVIENLAARYSNGGMMVGAGTVLDPETARIAILSGAGFVVAPSFNPETVRLCNRYRIPCMPGAMTVREVIEAMEAGADIIKLFPGELFGPAAIRAIHGPVPQARIMPTGGVSLENAGEWIRAGAVALGAGSSLVAGAKTGEYGKITQCAKAFIETIAQARK